MYAQLSRFLFDGLWKSNDVFTSLCWTCVQVDASVTFRGKMSQEESLGSSLRDENFNMGYSEYYVKKIIGQVFEIDYAEQTGWCNCNIRLLN